MGGTFWFLFIVQVVILLFCLNLIFKVEKERPTESLVPATDNDVEIY